LFIGLLESRFWDIAESFSNPPAMETLDSVLMRRRRKIHRPEIIVSKLRDADAVRNAGIDLVAVQRALKATASTSNTAGAIPVVDTSAQAQGLPERATSAERPRIR